MNDESAGLPPSTAPCYVTQGKGLQPLVLDPSPFEKGGTRKGFLFWLFSLLAFSLFVAAAMAQPAAWQPRGMGGGGALFQPAVNPMNAAEMYISCDMGDEFHSTDAGESWQNSDFHQLTGGTVCGVAFTGDPQIRYAISRDVSPNADANIPKKSTDGGQTWTTISPDPTGGGAYSVFADYDHPQRLLLSDYSHLYYSSGGGASFQTVSTRSSGLYIGGVFFKGDSIFVATPLGLLVSLNGGQSFSIANIAGIPAGEVFLSLAGAVQANRVSLACVTAQDANVYPGITGLDHNIYVGTYTLSFNGGAWVSRAAAIPTGMLPFWAGMARADTATVWLSGYNTYWEGVLKSTNGGASWTQVFLTTNNQNIATGYCGQGGDLNWGWAEAPLGLAVCATDPNRALTTDEGFAHLTTNGGTTWKQVYLSTADQNPAGLPTPKHRAYHSIGLEPTSVWNVMWVDSAKMVASYTDIVGMRSTDGGQSWSRPWIDTTGSFGVNTIYHVVKDSQTGRLYAATSSVHDMYMSTHLTDASIDNGRGQLWTSADSGRTWQMIHDFAHPVIYLALDPNNSHTLYASVIHSTAGGIFRSGDIQNGSGASWSRLGIPPRTEGHPLDILVLNDGTLLCTYSGRRAGSPQAFTQSSGVFVSTDNGVSWQDRSSPQMVYWTKDVLLDPFDSAQNTWYAAVHRGWGGAPNDLGGVFRTTNRGQTWTQISNLLYAESCAPSPLDSNAMYLTTEVNGLYYTSNLRSPLPTFTSVASYPFRQPERVFYNPYRAGEVWVVSFGNGMYEGSTALPPVQNLTVYQDTVGVTLRWPAIPGARSYKIYGSATVDFASPLVLGTTVNTSFTHAATATVYFYRVTADSNP